MSTSTPTDRLLKQLNRLIQYHVSAKARSEADENYDVDRVSDRIKFHEHRIISLRCYRLELEDLLLKDSP